MQTTLHKSALKLTTLALTTLIGQAAISFAIGMASAHASGNAAGYGGGETAQQAIPLAADRGYTGEKIMDAYRVCAFGTAESGTMNRSPSLVLNVLEQLQQKNKAVFNNQPAALALNPHLNTTKELIINSICGVQSFGLHQTFGDLTASCEPRWTSPEQSTNVSHLALTISRPNPQQPVTISALTPTFKFAYANQENVLNMFGEEDTSKVIFYGLSILSPKAPPQEFEQAPRGTFLNTVTRRATRFKYSVQEFTSCLSQELSKN